MIRAAQQAGYILLPVIVVITLVAAIALLMNTESALESNTAASELDAQQAQYVAAAGLNHALWLTRQQGCGAYTNLTDVALGSDKYTTNLTTDLGATTSYSVNVDQDGWIREDQPTANKATDLKLHTKYEIGKIERPLLRYDLGAIPAKATILSATAWFYVTNVHPEGPVDIHALTADWLETDATWDSMNDKIDKVVLTSIPAQPSANVWVSANLASQVQAWVNGQPNYGITLNSTSEDSHGQYNSRESANVPYLQVIVGTPPSSPATLKGVGTLANGVIRSMTRDDVTLYQNPPSLLQFQPDSTLAVDSYIWAANKNTNYGNDDETWVATGSSNEALALFKFDLADIPPGARVLGASLSVYERDGNDANVPVSAYRITNDWEEDEVTWNKRDNANDWDNPGGDYDPDAVSTTLVDSTGPGSPNPRRYEWDVSSLVQGWINGSFANHGVVLRTEEPGIFGERFDTSDHADPTHHPRLNISYTCACGEVCVQPQGSGRIVMIGNWSGPNPDSRDLEKEAIIESWGYQVDQWNENLIWAIDFNNYDLVYISETTNSASVIGQLSWRSIAIVNEQGNLNSDLGFSTTKNTTTGDSIDIVDNSHFISLPFALGGLSIYSAPMEILTAGGTSATELTVLGEAAGSESLMLLDVGAAGVNGPAPGRRVALPLGRSTNSNFNWTYLNNNGRLLVQRALEWGIGKIAGGASGDLLLVVVDPGSLTAQENTKQQLFESWGYTVILIDESDNQTEFDAAVAVNDVVYITEDVASSSVNIKLVNAAIGVVTEEDNLSDEFGMAASIAWENGTQVEINDNSHYITSPFSLGLLTFLTANESLAYVTGAQSPHLGKLASSTSGYGVVTLEAGDAMFGGGSAAGRRAQLPWGGDNFDVNHLNADGLTILRRALEWGTGASLSLTPLAHWKLDETTGITAVDSVGGHNGTLANGPSWSVGMRQGGLDFDGVDDKIDIPPDANLDDIFSGGATVSAWIRASGWGEGNFGRIADKADNLGSNRNGWAFELYGANRALLFQYGFSGGIGNWYTPVDSIALGTWHHIAVVYDNSLDANDPTIYVDGVAQTLVELDTPSGTASSDAAIDLALGNYALATSRTFDGILDDIRIHDRMLGAAEIEELAALPGPIAHWKLDDGAGLTAVDSASTNDGTLNGPPAWVSGAIGDALDFDGSNDYVNAGSFDVTGSGVTMMGWFNAEAIATDDGRIVSKANGPNEADAWWQLSTTDSGSNRYLRMRIKAGGTTTTFADSSVNLVTDQWYFAVGTYDSVSGDMKLYLDGAEVVNGSHAVGGAIDTDAAVPVAIGANGTAERFFNGILDDVRVYDYALSTTEIADLFAAGSSGGGGSPTIFEDRVAAGNDDAEERVSNGNVNLTSSDLELVFDGSNNQLVGMRFTNVTVPNGATISNAYIQFQVDETNSGATNVNIQGQAIDDAPTFTTGNSNISSRSRTLAIVPWTPVPWTTVGEAGADQQTPNIATVIQEIIDRPGWVSSNDLVIIMTGSGERTAESYNGDSSGAALLHIEY